MKIVPKLTLAVAVGASAIMAVHTAVRVSREVDYFESDMRHDHEVLGQAMAAGFAEEWKRAGPADAKRFLSQANAAERHVHVGWVSLDIPPGAPGGPVAGVDVQKLRQGRETSIAVRRGKGVYFTYVPAKVVAHPGAIELAESLDQERRYVTTTVERSVATTLALAATFLLVAFYFGDRLVGQPIRRLIAHTRRIGQGQLGASLELDRVDEMSELAAGLNTMSADLAKARRQILAETETRIDALSQLRHADRLNTVGKLASGLAHELGTPLNVMAARAKMIETGTVEGDDACDNARIIREQSERVTAIIRQLLDFARPRGPKKMRCDLADVARKAAELLLPLAKKRQVAIHVESGEGDLAAELDPDQIHQVVANLISNGIQAMPEGGDLRVRVQHEGRKKPPQQSNGLPHPFLAMTVSDQGIGMDAETASRVFEPFFSTKPVGEGTGLGLSVSFGIVREHGGWIDVQSQPGKGASFTVHLPCSEE